MASHWGEIHDEKIAAFYKSVEVIEKKHIGVFKDEISKLTAQYPYILTNYFLIQWYHNKYELVFCTDVYISVKIKDDLTAAFHEIFLSNNPVKSPFDYLI